MEPALFIQLHIGLARASVMFSLIIGVYGFWRYFRNSGVSQDFWGVLAAGQVLYTAQALIGVIMVIMGLRPGRWVHFLYGLLSVISLPGAFAYMRGRDGRRELLIYALVGLFMAGVSLRAMGTVR